MKWSLVHVWPGRYEGFLERVNDSLCLVGWARSRMDAREKVVVEVYDGSQRLGEIRADRWRADLEREGKGDGAHAFVFPFPPEVFHKKEFDIKAKIKGTDFYLQQVKNFYTCLTPVKGSRYNGACEIPTRGKVRGWVCVNDMPKETVTVEVCDGSRVLLEVRANEFRRDLLRSGVGTGYYGFQFILPDTFFDGKNHLLIVRTHTDGVVLRNCPLVLSAATLQNFLCQTTRGILDAGCRNIQKMMDAGLLSH